MEDLLTEIRVEFQIPPYFENEHLKQYLKEGISKLSNLNPGRDAETDLIYRSLLKNYVYYAYHHRLNEWESNYASTILSWQMGTEVE